MADDDEGALEAVQPVLEPVDGAKVEMVGRLVEQQDIGILGKCADDRSAPPLAAARAVDLARKLDSQLVGNCRGLVRCRRHESLADAADLLSMWVAPEARGRGIGMALIDTVADWARSAGLLRLVLEVRLHNAHALALYTRAGFVPTGKQQVPGEIQLTRRL